MVDSTRSLQLILGPDKNNPSFCVYTDEEEKEFHVYYGLELLEVVPNDREAPAYRLLAARLYNAKVRVRTLEEVFGLDRKTMRKWGLALRSGNRQWLIDVLQGRWGRRKLTLEMESFVRHRYQSLRAEGCRDYRQVLCKEVERVFGVKVSGEILRPVLASVRAQQDRTPSPSSHASSERAKEPWSQAGSEQAGVWESPVEGQSPEAKEERSEMRAEGGVVESSTAAVVQNLVGTRPGDGGPVGPEAKASEIRDGKEEVSCAAEASPALALPASSKILPPKQDWSEGQTAWCEQPDCSCSRRRWRGSARRPNPSNRGWGRPWPA